VAFWADQIAVAITGEVTHLPAPILLRPSRWRDVCAPDRVVPLLV